MDLGLHVNVTRLGTERDALLAPLAFAVSPGAVCTLMGPSGVGKSSLLAVDTLKETGIKVKGMLAIFTYGFEIAEDNFKNAAVSLHTLSDYKNLLQLAEKSNYITASEAEVLAAWRMNPDTWGQ